MQSAAVEGIKLVYLHANFSGILTFTLSTSRSTLLILYSQFAVCDSGFFDLVSFTYITLSPFPIRYPTLHETNQSTKAIQNAFHHRHHLHP
jgi:hypothetical protein